MIFKTVVPKLGDPMHYIGKPVHDENGLRIGSISDVIDDSDHFILIMNVENKELDMNEKG